MKKIGFIIAAFVLVLGLSQCKKPNVKMYNGYYVGTTQDLSFTTNGGGAKIDLNNVLNALNLTWESGDELVVYGSATYPFSGGKYCGTMTINPDDVNKSTATFSGTLNDVPADGGSLRFCYFASGCNYDAEAHTATLDLLNQDGALKDSEGCLKNRIVAYVDLEVDGSDSYSGTLEVPYSMLKLDIHRFAPATGSATVKMSGNAYKGMEFLADGNINYVNVDASGDNAGVCAILTVDATNSTAYNVAVMPGNQTLTWIGNGRRGIKSGDMKINTYYTANANGDGILVPVSASSGKFSVADGKQVYFSSGNLQYRGQESDGQKWRFADNQWDVLGSGPGTWGENNHGNVNLGTAYEGKYNTGNSNYPNDEAEVYQQAARDLFGWGTSGKNHNGRSFQPYSTASGDEKYYAYYSEYHSADKNLNDSPGTADWGVNEIYNAGTGWRTMTGGSGGEWEYLLKRKKGDNNLWGFGTINGVKGLIILPDDWAKPAASADFTYGSFPSGNQTGSASFTDNTYTTETWAVFETSGAVFLPLAGYRTTNVLHDVSGIGAYWTVNNRNGSAAHELCINYNNNNTVSPITANGPKSAGRAVRLVHE